MGQGLDGEGVEAADAQPGGGKAGGLAGFLDAVGAFTHRAACVLGQGVGAGQGDELAAIAAEEGAAHAFFEGVQGAVHADGALAQGLGYPGHAAVLDEAQKDFELAEGDLLIDLHGGVLKGSLDEGKPVFFILMFTPGVINAQFG